MRIIKTRQSNFYSATALIIAILLGFFSGWSEVGFDRANYLIAYLGVISSDDWLAKILFAKDVMFLVAVQISNFFSDDAKLAFFLVCTTSVFLKYFAIRKLAPEHALGFIIAYAVFLSPGLEFAAIRSALAIGFVMLALVYRDRTVKFYLFSMLAIASHLSSLLVIILASRSVGRLCIKYRWGYGIIFLAAFIFGDVLIKFYPHGLDYVDNKGTVLALALPVCTLVVSWFVFFRIERFSKLIHDREAFANLSIFRTVTYGLIFVGFGLAPTIVTATTRYLEFSWCLLLLVSVTTFGRKYINVVGGVLLIALLSYLNVGRDTWLAIINPNIV